MSEENETVKALITRRAGRIKGNEKYTNHIKEFLDWRGNNSDVDVCTICAVDAMIYDVGAALDSRFWKSRRQRRKMLQELFPQENRVPD